MFGTGNLDRRGYEMKALYAICVLLTGCAALPEKIVEVKIPIATFVPCKPNIPKPGICLPKDDTRVSWLQCALVDRERNQAYIKQLEAALAVCAD